MRPKPGNGKAPRRDKLILGSAVLPVQVLDSAADGRPEVHQFFPCTLHRKVRVPLLPLSRRDTPNY
ncbi:hypothetical protein AXF42_Ash018668 [Apostasia shenzhenica]|uniref:Uncharacterized protein n=1 Tax=Apostasia shenzhenica TaxID=1088818 RepID=A0A2I0B1K9_9ASPA|nr:hypothetical protein AXF42_Ash018668 [Apostasia shenzhenica]